MTPQITGIHHVTAICRDPERNVRFYTNVLGLRMVKITVNQDAPTVYHLYYGDEEGTPGSVLTFFPWPRAKPGRPGVGQANVVSFAIRPTSLGYWTERLINQGIKYDGPRRQFDETRIAFRDPDRLMLELVAHPDADERPCWDEGPVPAEHAIRGFHSVTLWEDSIDQTDRLLTDSLGFRSVAERRSVRRYAVGDGGPGKLVDVRATPDFWEGVVSAGTVHHLAWRTSDDAQHRAWRETVADLGYNVTPVIDRHYFRSIYFREPGGVLFEIATDPPGFTIDEPVAELGSKLVLPPWLEDDRERIERLLPAPPARLIGIAQGTQDSVTPSDPQAHMNEELGFAHQYVPASKRDPLTLLLLHGTGGTEHDLIPLGQEIAPGAALLSPRGQVDESGMARFFRRLEPGVFDVEDLQRRTHELGDFVSNASRDYGFDARRVIAVGYSNGANVAGSLLLLRPDALAGAVLFRSMLPFEPETLPDLTGKPVLICAGRNDPTVPREQTERLAELLRRTGAEIDVHWHDGGHELSTADVEAAGAWLADRV